MKYKDPAELVAVSLLLAFLDGALEGDGEREGPPLNRICGPSAAKTRKRYQ